MDNGADVEDFTYFQLLGEIDLLNVVYVVLFLNLFSAFFYKDDVCCLKYKCVKLFRLTLTTLFY